MECCFMKLPVELIYEVFRFLDPYFLHSTVRLVCKHFALILSDEFFWQKSVASSYKPSEIEFLVQSYELNSDRWKWDNDLHWRDLSVQISKHKGLWLTNDKAVVRHEYKYPHCAVIDCVKIIGDGRYFLSGGRDRLVALWDIRNTDLQCPAAYVNGAHDGWVWSFDSCEQNSFYSCGWDSFVKRWQIGNGIHKIGEFDCGKPAMTVACLPRLVVAGLHVPKIVAFDPRVSYVKGAFKYYAHRATITDLKILDNYIISVSEDKTLAMFDLRNLRLRVSQCPVTKNEAYPRSLGVYHKIVYVGDSHNSIYMYNLDNPVTPAGVVQTGSADRQISALVPTLHCVVAGSTDFTVRFIFPSNPHRILNTYHFDGEVTSVDYRKGSMIVATANNTITAFLPSEKCTSI